MMDSTLYNQGSCLPPQLPPLPPPPQIFSPPNWMPPYPPIPPRPFFLPPQTPPIIFQSPPRHYYGSGRMFVRGRGRDRGRGGGTSRAGHKGDLQKCTTCDRVYKSEETYLEHMQSHVKCSECDFSALPKKVKEHSLVHSLPDFLNFTSAEDIKKWREERRKNYPTTSNIAKKKALEESRKERGQVMDTPLHRYVNQLIGDYDSRCRGRGRGGRRGSFRGRWNSNRRQHCQEYKSQTFDGTKEITLDNQTPLTGGSTPTPNSHCEIGPRERFRERNRGRGRRERPRRTKRERPQEENRSCVTKKPKTNWRHLSIPSRPTLLEKLLAPVIRSEYNAILQCVRHTVQNNFFDEPVAKIPDISTADMLSQQADDGEHHDSNSD